MKSTISQYLHSCSFSRGDGIVAWCSFPIFVFKSLGSFCFITWNRMCSGDVVFFLVNLLPDCVSYFIYFFYLTDGSIQAYSMSFFFLSLLFSIVLSSTILGGGLFLGSTSFSGVLSTMTFYLIFSSTMGYWLIFWGKVGGGMKGLGIMWGWCGVIYFCC